MSMLDKLYAAIEFASLPEELVHFDWPDTTNRFDADKLIHAHLDLIATLVREAKRVDDADPQSTPLTLAIEALGTALEEYK